MSQINPITGSILQSNAAQRVQAEDKAAQLKRVEKKRTNTTTGEEVILVESPTEIDPVADEQQPQKQPQPRQKKRHAKPGYSRGGKPSGTGEEDPNLDIRA